MPRIHPTACVDRAAQIGDGVEIGPYCVVGPDVAIGPGAGLLAHVHVAGHTSIGEGTVIYPFASLGTPPQSVRYRGGPTRLVVGRGCDIRESVTMNIGTEDGGGITEVGERGFFMANSHVGHDCRVGREAVFANGATLGGHCRVGDHVVIGGLSAAHQYSRIGSHAMIAGLTGVRADVIPFGVAIGAVGQLAGFNAIGMRRRKFSRESIQAVRKAYRMLFFGEGTFAGRVDLVDIELGADAAVAAILAFVREGGSRPLCHPRGDYRDLSADA
jgi:UDP-N-acetylglucosamine acyltransferase